jgi:cytochrome P450
MVAPWILLHTASRPEIWYICLSNVLHGYLPDEKISRQSVYDEQVAHFGNGDGTFRDVEYEDLRDLPVLDSLIRETLRVHPPIHSILVRPVILFRAIFSDRPCNHSVM